jgi:hypothetical protein
MKNELRGYFSFSFTYLKVYLGYRLLVYLNNDIETETSEIRKK